MRYYVLIVFFLFCAANAQVKKDSTQSKDQDTLVIDSGVKDSMEIYKPTINDYQYQKQYSEKKVFDTSFAISRSYQFSQYNNQDNFGKIPFANIGSGFQNLVFERNSKQNLELLPTNKAHMILGINDIRYYDVKTPTTTFVYHNAMRNGGELQSTYTQNVGKTFNFAVEYLGLRSEGLYQNSLSSNNNVVFSAHYLSKNSRYEFFTHFLHQNVDTEENGGIADLSLFLSGDNDFNNRENVEVNLTNTDSRFSYRRYYFSQQFAPFNVEKFPFKIKHTIYHQGNKYYYIQDALESYYYDNDDEIISGMPLNSKKYSKNLSNAFSLLLDKEKLKFEAGIRYQNITFGTDNIQLAENPYEPKIYKENRFGVIGKLQMKLSDKFDLNSSAEFSNGSSFGNYILAENNASFAISSDYKASVFLNFQSAAPSFNYLLNHSSYLKFNYDFSDFQNQNILEMGGKVNLKFFDSQLFAKYFRIDQFTYFDENALPKQSGTSVNISQIGGEANFQYRKFHLNTKLLFQSTLTNKELFPAPDFIGRFNLYYQAKAFKNAAEIQSGVKLYYFTKFASRNFSPMLNEFVLANANSYQIGGQPIVDVYFNMRVKRMFFFVEGQQITTTFTQNKSYTAPYYPIYDFRLNIGIVWYLFH